MIEDLIEKQKELMEQVPHGVNNRVLVRMDTARDVIEKLLLYLSSCGHKPWRPKPLSREQQDGRFKLFLAQISRLESYHKGLLEAGPLINTKGSRNLVSALGVIEEAVEYLDAVDKTPSDRQSQLEEITDILFFYLELLVLGGFTWAEIEEEYMRKHAVNLERYRRAKEGDYGWNHRDEGRL